MKTVNLLLVSRHKLIALHHPMWTSARRTYLLMICTATWTSYWRNFSIRMELCWQQTIVKPTNINAHRTLRTLPNSVRTRGRPWAEVVSKKATQSSWYSDVRCSWELKSWRTTPSEWWKSCLFVADIIFVSIDTGHTEKKTPWIKHVDNCWLQTASASGLCIKYRT